MTLNSDINDNSYVIFIPQRYKYYLTESQKGRKIVKR